MATHAQLAAKLLRDAAQFFREVGSQNPPIKKDMDMNAQTYDTVADLVEQEPLGQMDMPAPGTD